MTELRGLLLLLVCPALLAGQSLAPSQPSQAAGVSARAYRAAQAPQVELALADAVALALRDNRAIRSAYLERIAQKFELRVAGDRFAPQLALKARYLGNRNRQDRYRQADLTPAASLLTPYGTRLSLDWAYGHTRADAAGPRYRDGANLLVIQPLLRGAGPAIAGAPLLQAQLSEQANRLALKDTVAQTITQTIGLYRELLRAQEQLRIATDALQRSNQLVEVNRSLIAAGRMPAFDIVQAQAQVAGQELALEDSRNRLHASRLALLQALALDLATPLLATERPQAQHVQVDVGQALQQAKALQPGYLMQLIAEQQAHIGVRLARDEQRWDLSLLAGASQARERPGSQRDWEQYVGLELEIPIGDLSRRQALVRAEVSLATQQERMAESLQQLQRQVTDGVRETEVRWRQLEIAGRALALSRRKLEIEQEKLALGRSSNFQVLSFEGDLRDAQSVQLDALIGYLNAQAELDLALGTTLDSWEVALND